MRQWWSSKSDERGHEGSIVSAAGRDDASCSKNLLEVLTGLSSSKRMVIWHKAILAAVRAHGNTMKMEGFSGQLAS